MELIDKFLSIYAENQADFFLNPGEVSNAENNKQPFDSKLGRKQIALKILTINVTSYLKWDLNVIEKNFIFQKQIQLMEDFCTITSGMVVNLPIKSPLVVGVLGNQVALDFAMFIYHRWILRVYRIFKDTITKKTALAMNPQIPSDMNLSPRDELFISILDPIPQASVDYLLNMCNTDESLPILTLSSILSMSTNTDHSGKNFEFRHSISAAEVKTQIYYDLCQLYMFINSNELAKKYAILCRENSNLLKKETAGVEFRLCDVNDEDLQGILLACGESDIQFGLLQRMNVSIINRYDGILDILREDNLKLEIPFVQRKILELDLEGLIVSQPYVTKELEMNVIALNTVRYIIDDGAILHGTDFVKKYPDGESFKVFCGVTKNYLSSHSGVAERERIMTYFVEAIGTSEYILPELEDVVRDLFLFPEATLVALKASKFTRFALPPVAIQTEWTAYESSCE